MPTGVYQRKQQKNKRIELVCLSCKEHFDVNPSSSHRKYCSQRCASERVHGVAWNKGAVGSPKGDGSRSQYKSFWQDGGPKHVHRAVMEKRLGRVLTRTDVVHHWDEDKRNNEDSNLGFFRGHAAHIRIHQFAGRHGLKVKSLRFIQSWLQPVCHA